MPLRSEEDEQKKIIVSKKKYNKEINIIYFVVEYASHEAFIFNV
jgi:hypothetical protein